MAEYDTTTTGETPGEGAPESVVSLGDRPIEERIVYAVANRMSERDADHIIGYGHLPASSVSRIADSIRQLLDEESSVGAGELVGEKIVRSVVARLSDYDVECLYANDPISSASVKRISESVQWYIDWYAKSLEFMRAKAIAALEADIAELQTELNATRSEPKSTQDEASEARGAVESARDFWSSVYNNDMSGSDEHVVFVDDEFPTLSGRMDMLTAGFEQLWKQNKEVLAQFDQTKAKAQRANDLARETFDAKSKEIAELNRRLSTLEDQYARLRDHFAQIIGDQERRLQKTEKKLRKLTKI